MSREFKKARLVLDREFPVGKTDDRLFGSFIEHLGRAVYEGIYQPGHPAADADGLRKDVLQLVREARVPLVRYPGGNFVSGYHWEDGVGPVSRRPARPDPAWQVIESNEFGLNEFMNWVRKAGAAPMMAVNLGTRGVEEAAALLEYCNLEKGTFYSDLRRQHGVEKPYHIKLWCLGNEMDGPWQTGHKTASEYGRLAAETSRLMKMLDPDIETVACGSSGLDMPTFGSWEMTVLQEAFEEIDYISLHQYYGNRDGNTPDFLASSLAMNRFIQEVVSICDCAAAIRHSRKQIHLSFDEWNVWYHSNDQDREIPKWCRHPHQLEDVYNLEDALLVGSMLITLLNHADRVKIACLAQLVNVIAPIMTSDTGAWRQTIYYPYMQASLFGRGTVLQTKIKTDSYESRYGDAPYVEAAAVEKEETGELAVFAVNRNLSVTYLLEADLRQYPGLLPLRHIMLTGSDLKAVNTEKNPDCVSPEERQDIGLENGHLQVPLPPASWNVILLGKPEERV